MILLSLAKVIIIVWAQKKRVFCPCGNFQTKRNLFCSSLTYFWTWISKYSETLSSILRTLSRPLERIGAQISIFCIWTRVKITWVWTYVFIWEELKFVIHYGKVLADVEDVSWILLRQKCCLKNLTCFFIMNYDCKTQIA